MTCKNCGATIETQGRQGVIVYCPECGAILAKICQKCGVEMQQDDKFCTLCGQGYEQIVEPDIKQRLATIEGILTGEFRKGRLDTLEEQVAALKVL